MCQKQHCDMQFISSLGNNHYRLLDIVDFHIILFSKIYTSLSEPITLLIYSQCSAVLRHYETLTGTKSNCGHHGLIMPVQSLAGK